MAAADYKLCDVCGGKAFYDANITDPHYTATWEGNEEAEPIGLAVLCVDCNKTHVAIVQPRSVPAGYVSASEVQTAREVADLLPMLDADAMTISAMKGEIDRLRAGITAAAEGNYPMPVGERWRKDGQPSAHDRCIHGAMMNEGCGECLDAHLLALLDPPPAPDSGEGRT